MGPHFVLPVNKISALHFYLFEFKIIRKFLQGKLTIFLQIATGKSPIFGHNATHKFSG